MRCAVVEVTHECTDGRVGGRAGGRMITHGSTDGRTRGRARPHTCAICSRSSKARFCETSTKNRPKAPAVHTCVGCGRGCVGCGDACDADTIARVRRAGVELLRMISLHRQAGADLIYNAYSVDIGGG